VNAFLLAGTILLGAGGVTALALALRGSLLDVLVALQLVSAVGTLVLVLLAEGYGRSSYFVLSVVLAALSFVGGLVAVRLLPRAR
jgi:multisubunit Na+/H+ antiporter MnhF subunit